MKRSSTPLLMFLVAALPLIATTALVSPATAEVIPEGTPGPNDKVTCATTSWVFGTNGVKTANWAVGDFIAYPVANPDKDEKTPPVIGAGIKLNPATINLSGYIVRGSSTVKGTSQRRFFAWDTKDQLVTFEWNGSTKGAITPMSAPIVPPTPLSYADNRQLRTVDEAGNIFYFNATGDLMRATVAVDGDGVAKFTLTGETVLTRPKVGGSARALWASGDGVIQYIVNDQSYALKIDLDSHRLISPPRINTIKGQRGNEDYVASLGGSTDFALSRQLKAVLRYRYDPAATNEDNYWPVNVARIDRPEFATLTNFTGLMDGCVRKDLAVAPLAKPVEMKATAQTTFTQAQIGPGIIAGFKHAGDAVGWASTVLTGDTNSLRLDRHTISNALKIRPPMALAPEGEGARIFALNDKGTVLTGIGSLKAAGKDIDKYSQSMGGLFPTPPAATKLIDGPAIVVGVATNGDVWYSEHNGTTFATWVKIPGLTLDPAAPITLDAISSTSARFFTTGANKQVLTGLINRGATATYVTGIAPLPGGEIPRPGIGITYAKNTHTLAVASTQGTVYTLAETKNGWDPAWKQASPAGYTPGIPGIVDDTYNNRTYLFVRDQNNKLNLIKDNPATPGTYDPPTLVGNMKENALVDDPIIRPLTVEDTPSFGTVIRSTAGETLLVYAKFGAPSTPRHDVTFTLANPVMIAPANPDE